MSRKPKQPPRPTRWAIYKIGAGQIRLGEVEATNAREAVEKAAMEFEQYPTRLIAVKRPNFRSRPRYRS